MGSYGDPHNDLNMHLIGISTARPAIRSAFDAFVVARRATTVFFADEALGAARVIHDANSVAACPAISRHLAGARSSAALGGGDADVGGERAQAVGLALRCAALSRGDAFALLRRARAGADAIG